MADDKGQSGPSYGTDGAGGMRPDEKRTPVGAPSPTKDGAAVTEGGSGGGTAGTGGNEVLPGAGVGAGAAGVARGGGDDTGGLTLGPVASNDPAESNEARVNALGGGEDGRTTGAGLTGAGSATGDASAMRSEGGGAAGGAGLGGADAGSPGGMGGVRAQGGTGTDRPPGGLSPLTADPHAQDEDDGA